MIQGVLFDMDGVLFDTESIYIRAEAEAGRRMGVSIPEEYCKSFCGLNSRMINQQLARDYGDKMDVLAFRALSKEISLEMIRSNGLQPMPHVADTLAWLKEKGYKTAVASSTKTPLVMEFLNRSGFERYFDAVVGGEQVENGKPHPDIFQLAAEKLGLQAGSCVAVEDSHNGIRSAHAAGCVTVMIPDMLEATDEMREKATILDDMSQLPVFIENYNTN